MNCVLGVKAIREGEPYVASVYGGHCRKQAIEDSLLIETEDAYYVIPVSSLAGILEELGWKHKNVAKKPQQEGANAS